ncbi:phosphotransferase [Paenibacillus sp. FSL E2-0178]|uniref:phosphotransferase n=1 Tax=Paenibacillus sp. FSL E2-0178 TaxID=2921361 RepID=UPI00315846E3
MSAGLFPTVTLIIAKLSLYIRFRRELIGGVYFAEGGGKRYVLKIYRSFKTADALQSVRILDYLEAHSYPAVAALEHYGNELWSRMSELPRYFCHGNLHTGNMLRDSRGQYVLMDFDDASGDYPAMDVAYMSDNTHYPNKPEFRIIQTCCNLFAGRHV